MPYIFRNAQNKIIGLTHQPNGSSEYLPEGHPEVVAFRNPPVGPDPAAEIVAGIQAAQAAGAAASDLAGLQAAFADLCDALAGQQPGQASQIAGRPK